MSKKPKVRALDMDEIVSILASRGLFIASGVRKSEVRKRYNEHVRCGDDPIVSLVQSRMLSCCPHWSDDK